MLRLFTAEFKRSAILVVRYPLEAVVGLVILFFVLHGLVVGARHFAGSDLPTMGTGLEGLLVGFFCYVVVMTGVNHVVHEIEGDAKAGTLEILFMSPYSVQAILLVRAMVGAAQTFVTVSLIVAVELAITGTPLALTPLLVLPIVLLGLACIGLGLAAAGLALIFKKVQVVMAPLFFVFIFLVAFRPEVMAYPFKLLAFAIPFSSSIAAIRALAAGAGPEPSMLAAAAVWAVAMLAMGWGLLTLAIHRVRRLGIAHGY